MRSLRRMSLVALPVALSFTLGTALAEGETFETSPGLYAAAELGLGGRPLQEQLFRKGWPTTREFRRIAQDAEAAFGDSIGAILGSGMGVPLEASRFERERLDDMKNRPRPPATTDAMLALRWQAFAQVSGLASAPAGFKPIFIPYRHGDRGQLGQDTRIGLDGIGFAIYANTLFAEQQLAIVRTSGSSSLAGRTELDGFLGLVALECATAAMHELGQQLCLTFHGAGGKPELGAPPRGYHEIVQKHELDREYYYPRGFTARVTSGSVAYALGAAEEDAGSSLHDQAAILLGLCELAKASVPAKTGSGWFFGPDGKGAAFPDSTSTEAAELAAFVAESVGQLHWNPLDGKVGGLASFANNGAWGDTQRPEDAGLLLLALEQFLSLQDPRVASLPAVQKHMSVALDNTTAFLLSVQKTSSQGFCDSYNLSERGPAETRRSLGTQGIVVRGLLASVRASKLPAYAGKKHPEAREAAALVVRWLDETRWDQGRHSYTVEGAPANSVTTRDAAAVLGGLRDIAFETGDCRYLLRYKAYLTTLRARGPFLTETTPASPR